ncbi:MAG TPA: GNAT family N-acetyltransferase [Rhodoglobus sp.]|nr:GNAT family N-acetyltransferase [Rhodoglobus sp.]
MIRTERLLLRQWRESDREPWAALNADPEVREHFPNLLTRQESDEALDRMAAGIDARGWGLWAVEHDGALLGFTGLNPVGYETPFTPATEIGWRFARHAWGSGFATEAARAALAYGFDEVGLEEIVSFTATTNTRSMAVMERIGMVRDAAEDFDHPNVEHGHRLERHVLYRLRRP